MPHAYLSRARHPVRRGRRSSEYGSRDAVARWIAGGDDDPRLGPDEAAFVAERDTFFLATVGETGWPYVQHRGGPPGFLRVLDDGATLAWADLRGNRQYLSVGNLAAEPRVSLLLLDQAHARRLKVLGTATVHDVRAGDPDGLLAQVAVPEQQRRVERVVTVRVERLRLELPAAHHPALHGRPSSRRCTPSSPGCAPRTPPCAPGWTAREPPRRRSPAQAGQGSAQRAEAAVERRSARHGADRRSAANSAAAAARAAAPDPCDAERRPTPVADLDARRRRGPGRRPRGTCLRPVPQDETDAVSAQALRVAMAGLAGQGGGLRRRRRRPCSCGARR